MSRTHKHTPPHHHARKHNTIQHHTHKPATTYTHHKTPVTTSPNCTCHTLHQYTQAWHHQWARTLPNGTTEIASCQPHPAPQTQTPPTKRICHGCEYCNPNTTRTTTKQPLRNIISTTRRGNTTHTTDL